MKNFLRRNAFLVVCFVFSVTALAQSRSDDFAARAAKSTRFDVDAGAP